jgi:hypothetical protein
VSTAALAHYQTGTCRQDLSEEVTVAVEVNFAIAARMFIMCAKRRHRAQFF